MLLVPGSISLNSVYHCAAVPAGGDSEPAALSLEVGGYGAVSAVAAARAGADVHLMAAVGSDPAADALETLLSAEGLPHTLLRLGDAPTATCASIVPDVGFPLCVCSAGANTLLTLPKPIDPFLQDCGTLLCHLDSNQRSTHALLREARQRGIRAVLNLSGAVGEPLEWLVRVADVLVVDDAGLSELVRQLHPGGLGDFTGGMIHGLPDARLHELCRATAEADIVLRLGSRGAFVSSRDGARLLQAAPGDISQPGLLCDTACFAGVLAAACERGAELREAVVAALAAVALSQQAGGLLASLPHAAAIERKLSGR